MPGSVRFSLNFYRRMHNHEPNWNLSTIKDNSWNELDFSVLENNNSWKNLVKTHIINTTNKTILEVAKLVKSWIKNN